MINKKIKCIFVTISLAVFTVFTGCGKEDGGKNGTSKAVYETIHSEGASFDIRVKDKGESYYYNPANIKKHTAGIWTGGLKSDTSTLLYYSIPSDKPCVFNSYFGYSVIFDGKYVYDYEKEIKPITSLTTINSSKDFFEALKSIQGAFGSGINFRFNGFKLSSENNIISFNKIEKNDYTQIEAEVTFVTHAGSVSNNGDTLFRGYIILTENKERQSAFFFGGLEGEFSENEMTHIKDSFILDDSKFTLANEDFEVKEMTFDFGGKKLTGEFPSMLGFEECGVEELEQFYDGYIDDWNLNEYHKIGSIIKFIKLDKSDYTNEDFLNSYEAMISHSGWEDGGDFIGKDGKVWKKGIATNYFGFNTEEKDWDCSNEIAYVCVDGDFAIEIYVSCYKLDAFSDVFPMFEKAISTFSITDGDSDEFLDSENLTY